MFRPPGLDPVLGVVVAPTEEVLIDDLFVLFFFDPSCTSGALSGASTGFLAATGSRGGGAGTGVGGAGIGLTVGCEPPPKHISCSPKFV